MTIAIDGRAAKFYDGSGIGNYSKELIKNITKTNNRHSINILYNENHNSNFKNSFWELCKTPLKLNSFYDLVLNPHNGMGLPNFNCEKIISTIHDIIPSKIPNTVSESYLKIYNENILKIIEKSNLIITVSKFSKEDMIKTFSIKKDKIHITYLSHSEIYKPLNKDFCKNFLKSKYKIDFKYILYVGSFSPRKNILRLIRAFSKICCENNEVNLIIVGIKGASYEIYLKECIKLKITNRVFFTGFVKTSDLPYFYNNALCFVYPSFYEGFGLPPLEAMACKTPVITSNLTSMPEILKDSPLYVNPYNTDDIYSKLNLILNDDNLRNSLITKGFNHSKNFSWKNTSLNTLNIFEKI